MSVKVGTVVVVNLGPVDDNHKPETHEYLSYNGQTGIVAQVHEGYVIVLMSLSGKRIRCRNEDFKLVGI